MLQLGLCFNFRWSAPLQKMHWLFVNHGGLLSQCQRYTFFGLLTLSRMDVCRTYTGPSLHFRNRLLKRKEIFSHFYVTFFLKSTLTFARRGFYRKQIVIQWMLPTAWQASNALLPTTSVKHMFLNPPPPLPSVFHYLGAKLLRVEPCPPSRRCSHASTRRSR